jgi:hypothetical protein
MRNAVSNENKQAAARGQAPRRFALIIEKKKARF